MRRTAACLAALAFVLVFASAASAASWARPQIRVAVLNIDPTDRWIYHVGVAQSERNRGVGGLLLSRSLEDYWRQHPGETLGLDVDRGNTPAIKLYRRQGFAPWLVFQTFELPL